MKLVRFVFLIVTGVCLLLTIGCARKSDHTTKVTVAGEATTRVEPDTALLIVSVVTQSPQAITAQQENARKSNAVADAIKSLGVKSEIKTSDYTLQPQYDYRDGHLPRIVSYDARNTVIVTTSELNKVGAVIDAASRAGANSVDSVSFTLRQTNPVRGQALSEATQQAMNKAQSIALALGGRVLRVVEENESSTVAGEPQVYDSVLRRASTMNGSILTPITAGQLNIKSNVQLVVEIET